MINYELDRVSNFRLGLFATGSYQCKCIKCKQQFTGDKRAMQCLDCAIEEVDNLLGWYEDKIESIEEKLCLIIDTVETSRTNELKLDLEVLQHNLNKILERLNCND